MDVVGFVVGSITRPFILHNINSKHVWASSIFFEKKKWIRSSIDKRKIKMHAIFSINEFPPSSSKVHIKFP